MNDGPDRLDRRPRPRARRLGRRRSRRTRSAGRTRSRRGPMPARSTCSGRHRGSRWPATGSIRARPRRWPGPGSRSRSGATRSGASSPGRWSWSTRRPRPSTSSTTTGRPSGRPRPGRRVPGVAAWATEAPRGLLFHRYELDEAGRVATATDRAADEPEPGRHRGRPDRDFAPSVLRPAARRGDAPIRAAHPELRPMHLVRDALPRPPRGATGRERSPRRVRLLVCGNADRGDDGAAARRGRGAPAEPAPASPGRHSTSVAARSSTIEDFVDVPPATACVVVDTVGRHTGRVRSSRSR